MLQPLLSARLAPCVTHPPFEEAPERYPAPHQQARLRLLRIPRGLDNWEPH